MPLLNRRFRRLKRLMRRTLSSYSERLELERQVRQIISNNAQAITRNTSQQDLRQNIASLKGAADPSTLVVGSAEFNAISAQAAVFEKAIVGVEAAVKGAANSLADVVNAQLASWKTKEQSIVKQIDDKKTRTGGARD